MTQCYAGRSHDDAVAARAGQRKAAQEQAGGDMAVAGTEADAQHSCGELTALGKAVWRQGSGIDGGGMVLATPAVTRRSSAQTYAEVLRRVARRFGKRIDHAPEGDRSRA